MLTTTIISSTVSGKMRANFVPAWEQPVRVRPLRSMLDWLSYLCYTVTSGNLINARSTQELYTQRWGRQKFTMARY